MKFVDPSYLCPDCIYLGIPENTANIDWDNLIAKYANPGDVGLCPIEKAKEINLYLGLFEYCCCATNTSKYYLYKGGT